MTERCCAFCHGYSDARNTIVATRFQRTEQQGNQIIYWFCDAGCRQMWLDRAEASLSAPAQQQSRTLHDHT